MTSLPLFNRLTALADANKQTVTLINRLARLHFQPGSTALDGDDEDARTELSAEIHDNLKQQEEELEILRQEIEDLSASEHSRSTRRISERQKESTRVSVQAARLAEDLRR